MEPMETEAARPVAQLAYADQRLGPDRQSILFALALAGTIVACGRLIEAAGPALVYVAQNVGMDYRIWMYVAIPGISGSALVVACTRLFLRRPGAFRLLWWTEVVDLCARAFLSIHAIVANWANFAGAAPPNYQYYYLAQMASSILTSAGFGAAVIIFGLRIRSDDGLGRA